MRILLTGGCGFIGSNMVNSLIPTATIDKIIVLDKMAYCSNINNLIKEEKVTVVTGNIANTDLVFNILQQYKIDTVIHMAAESHVDNSFGNSVLFTEENTLGTHKLLEACRNYGNIKKFVHISTDEVYGQNEDDKPFDETSVLYPSNPYASSKAGTEMMVRSYFISYKFPAIIIRMNNCYGPHQYPEKIVAKFIRLLLENKNLTIQDGGQQLRSFIYVKDACAAIKLILDKGVLGEIYNIGSNNEISMLDLGKMLYRLINKSGNVEFVDIEGRKFNDKRYLLVCDKLKALGWNLNKDKQEFENDLLETIDWYRNHSIEYWNR